MAVITRTFGPTRAPSKEQFFKEIPNVAKTGMCYFLYVNPPTGI